MPASPSVVSALVTSREEALYTLKAGPADGLRRPPARRRYDAPATALTEPSAIQACMEVPTLRIGCLLRYQSPAKIAWTSRAA